MAETQKKTPDPVVETTSDAPVKPNREEEMVDVSLHVLLETNDTQYGVLGEDEEGNPLETTVTVPRHIGEDLIRRQKEYDRMRRELVNPRKIGRFT